MNILKEANQVIEPKLFEMIEKAKGIVKYKQAGTYVCMHECLVICKVYTYIELCECYLLFCCL